MILPVPTGRIRLSVLYSDFTEGSPLCISFHRATHHLPSGVKGNGLVCVERNMLGEIRNGDRAGVPLYLPSTRREKPVISGRTIIL